MPWRSPCQADTFFLGSPRATINLAPSTGRFLKELTLLSPDAVGTSQLAPEAEPAQAPDCSARSPGRLESLLSTLSSEPQPCSQDIVSGTHPPAYSQVTGKLPVRRPDPARPGAPPGEEGGSGLAGYLEATGGFIPPLATVWLVLGPARLVPHSSLQKAEVSHRGVMAGTEEPG